MPGDLGTILVSVHALCKPIILDMKIVGRFLIKYLKCLMILILQTSVGVFEDYAEESTICHFSKE
jgi:hypothetical protein